MNDNTKKPPVDRMAVMREMQARGELSSGMLGQEGYRRVALDKLVEDPKNERKKFDDLAGMIESVRQFGILEPIVVKPVEGGKYQIIIGHRRFRAAKAAELAMVEIIVRQSDDETKTRIKSIISNVQRENVNPIDMAEAMKSLLDDNQVATQRDLGQMIGKPEDWVSGMLRILSLPAALQTKLRLTEVPLNYDAVTRIARLKNETHQEGLVDMLLKGATQKEIRESIGAIAGEPGKSKAKATAAKPKQAFTTSHKSVVIVQSLSSTLPFDRVIASLTEALKKARGEQAGEHRRRSKAA
jgi:ParB/RepB/Spo0J family partition protein